MFIPLAECGHFLLYQVTISDSSIFAIKDTDFHEAIGYLQTYIGPLKCTLLLLVFLIFVVFTYKTTIDAVSLTLTKKTAILLVLLPCLFFYTWHLKNQTLFVMAWNRVSYYLAEQCRFTQNHGKVFQDLHLTTKTTLADTNPGTVIIVVGESACRDKMQAYNPSFPLADTPWLTNKTQNNSFIFYKNAYACYNQTVQALMQACTEMSQYNNKKFNVSTSFIDIAKKAGYHTYWLSNQGGMGQHDAPVTLIMKTADQHELPASAMNSSFSANNRLSYDEELLPLLKKINPQQNNFIVIHLMGSHVPYQARYPESATKFDATTSEGNYANSILYTDTVLHEIFDYAQKNMNLKIMLYFSDHGENLEHGHGPNVRTFDTLRIPMFLYLSPDYQQTYADKFNLLKSRENIYFTNDMIYNTVSGILNAPSNHYDAKEDLSSPAYNFTRDTLWTFKHTVPIDSDPI